MPSDTSAATRAVIRRGDETAARRLREHGWVVLSPEQVADLPAVVVAQIRSVTI